MDKKSESRTTIWRRQVHALQIVRAKLDAIVAQGGNDGLPMPLEHDDKLTTLEQVEYHERRRRHLERFPDYETGWGRPVPETAKAVWEPLAKRLEVQLDDIHKDPVTAQQLLMVALDVAVRSGRYVGRNLREDWQPWQPPMRRTLTRTKLFDAIARRWSDHARLARTKGRAFSVRDMREETAKASGRDLLLNGVQLHVLWKLVSGTWSRKSGRNPLYWANRAPRQGRNWSGYNVILRRHSRTLREFERFVRTDESYGPGRLEGVWRLWIEGQERPPFDVHPKICAEVPYNEVTIGERSEQVLRIQQQARLLFNTKAFVEDYTRVVFEVKALRHELRTTYPFPKRGEPKRPQGSAERQLIRKYRSARAFVMEFRAVYEQVKSVGDVPALPVGLVSLRGFLPIRSVFYRVLNRRYQPAHFWPLAVSTKLDGQLAVPDFWSQAVDGTDEAPLLQERTSTRGRWFAPATGVIGPQRLVGADISSSQTQLLAVLIGLEGMEREASSTETPFKHLLAQRAWEMHQERGDLLRAGYDGVKNYEGPRDDRLIELVKTLWMRRLYGSTVRQVIVDQSWDPDTFGPGWVDTTVQGWSGLPVAHFLSTLKGYAAVEQFLNACRWIGEHADSYEGVTVVDPLDRSKFTWNPVARLDKKLRLGGLDVILSVPKGPERNGRYPVNRRELVNMIAPCLVHMLDAYFSALVLEELESRGVRELVAVHDCWYLPEAVMTDDGHFSGFGREILAESLNAAAKPWLKGLGPVYDRITFYLCTHPDFGPMLRTARAKWEDRVRRQDWPRFAAKPSALFQISRIGGRG